LLRVVKWTIIEIAKFRNPPQGNTVSCGEVQSQLGGDRSETASEEVAKNTTGLPDLTQHYNGVEFQVCPQNPEFDIPLRPTGFKTGHLVPDTPLHPCSESTGRHLITFPAILNRACCMA
jgi:hypothetical protein